jgi:hypothetical protein
VTAAPSATLQDSLADVSERLMAEFEDRLALDVISRVVQGCRADLDCSSPAALPELVDRLARQRLLDAAVAAGVVKG